MSAEGDNQSEENLDITSISNQSARYIIDLVRQGEQKIDSRFDKDVVLILGNTGSGKTTLAQFLGGDNNRLMSIKEGGPFGYYVIRDEDDKISISTVESKTIFPELIFDTKTNIVYIDNPGFNDTRGNEAYDIAAAYFINKVFDTTKNVKILLTVNYQSLLKGQSRNDFLTVLERTIALLKNIDRYTDSIMLVATKTDNIGLNDGIPIHIPDDAIFHNIVDFLLEVKETFEKWRNGGQKYTSLVQPVDSKLFYDNAIKLLEALLAMKDFQYPKLGIFRRPDKLSTISKIPLLQDGKKILVNALQRNLRYSSIDKGNIGYTISDKSKTVVRDLVAQINENIKSDMKSINTNFISYYRDLERNMLTDNVYVLRDHFDSASKALSLITNISDSASASDLLRLMCENFTSLRVRVSRTRLLDIANLAKFLTFLQKISSKKYESFTWKWVKELDSAVEYVENSLKWYNFLILLYNRLSQYDIQKKKESYSVPIFGVMPNEKIFLIEDCNEFKKFFDEISDANFLKTINYEDVSKIRLDDTKIRFFNLLIQTTIRNDDCTYFKEDHTLRVTGEYVLISEVIANDSYKSCSSVQIFAKHTVFVDASMKKDNDICIIAPRWEIIGDQRINLDGQQAPVYSAYKASDGQYPGCKGEDGEAGLPGSSAGHFFAVGSEFYNMNNLHIDANGGRGGQGQNGGNGAKGKMGETFDIAEVNNNSQEFHSEKNQNSRTKIEHATGYVFSLSLQVYLTQINFGNPGGQGGDGGDGGAGGIGGLPGEVITVDVSNTNAFSKCRVSARNGNSGLDGKPGKPGEGGEAGDDVQLEYRMCTWLDPANTKTTAKTAKHGFAGVKGGITCKNLRSPNIKRFLCPPTLVISDYRKELVKNFNNCFKKRISFQFYGELLFNPEVDKYYDASTLLREFQQLEQYRFKFTADTTLTLYDSILEKIRKLNPSLSQCDDSQLLECLYLAVDSKFLRLGSSSQHQAIIDLPDSFQKKLEKPITSLILEHTRFISTTLDIFIENHLDPRIENIEDSIIELSYPQYEEVNDDLQELANLLFKRKLFDKLKTFVQFLSVLCNFLNIDSLVVDKTQVDKVSIPTVKFCAIEISGEAKDSVENTIHKFHLNVVDAINSFSSIISTERKSYEKSIDARPHIVAHLQSIERSLQSSMYTSAKSFSISQVMENLANSMEKLRDLIEDENTVEMEIMKRIESRKKIIQFDSQLYKRVSHGNIERLVEALDSVENFSDELDNSNNNIETSITSILKTIQANIVVSYDLDKMSTTRNTLLSFMENLRAHLHLITKQSDIDGEFKSIIENLLEIVNLLQNAYDRMTHAEVEMRLFKYWSWVSEKKNLETLSKFMWQEYLLYEYDRHVDVFKQTILPFDVLTPDTFVVPSIPDDSFQSLDTLQKCLQNNLNSLQTDMEILLKNPPEKYIVKENERLLFEWKHELYAENIKNILLGKSIILTASIDPTDDRHFLRFTSIQLRFCNRETTHELSLDEALSKFNVCLKHSGNFSYMFCRRIHTRDEESCEYKHSYGDIAQAEQLRSPYAMWLFSLHPIDENVSFQSLRPFVDQNQPIDLQLVGGVEYLNVTDKSDVLEKYDMDTMVVDYSTLVPQ